MDCTAWITRSVGDRRGLRDLPDGVAFMSHLGMTKKGAVNPRTGAVTVYIKTGRYPAQEGDVDVYGMGFYWRPVQINGEEVLAVERSAGLARPGAPVTLVPGPVAVAVKIDGQEYASLAEAAKQGTPVSDAQWTPVDDVNPPAQAGKEE